MNNPFEKLVPLSHVVKVYIPSTIHDIPVDNSEYVKRASILLSECYGGATSSDAYNGSWVSNSGALISERVCIVYAYATDLMINNGLAKVYDFARLLRDEMKQEAVSIEIDNRLYFVD